MFKKLNNIFLADATARRVYQYLVLYPTPQNLNYFWNYGFMAGMFLGIQLISGIFLSMFYTPHIDYAFDSVNI